MMTAEEVLIDAIEVVGIDSARIDPAAGRSCDGCGCAAEPFTVTVDEEGATRCGNCLTNDRMTAQSPVTLEWDDVRAARTLLLIRSDWTQLPDVPEATRLLWAPRRTVLRDIPETEPTPRAALDRLNDLAAEFFATA